MDAAKTAAAPSAEATKTAPAASTFIPSIFYIRVRSAWRPLHVGLGLHESCHNVLIDPEDTAHYFNYGAAFRFPSLSAQLCDGPVSDFGDDRAGESFHFAFG